MFKETSRALSLVCGIAAALLATPAESQAFWWLKKKCACQQPTYASYYLATPCATQTCQYVPQTAYRVNYVTVPVTTYRPVVACDACGQQVVSMRPLIAYTRQAQTVAYQTYRLACSTAPVATAAYAAPAVGYAAPAVSYAAPVASSCCGTSGLSPSAAYAAPAYSVAPGGATTADAAATTAPSLAPGYVPNGSSIIQGSSSYLPGGTYNGYPTTTYPSSTYPQSTIIQQSQTTAPQNGHQEAQRPVNGTQPQQPAQSPPTQPSVGDPSRLVPIPDRNTNGGDPQTGVNGLESSHERAGPMILDPESRSTQGPARKQWWAYSPVSLQTAPPQASAPASPPKKVDDGGWRPSKR
jgi:hypothetical protein